MRSTVTLEPSGTVISSSLSTWNFFIVSEQCSSTHETLHDQFSSSNCVVDDEIEIKEKRELPV